jgi:hypothetical protein
MLRFFKDLLKGKIREPEPIKEPVAPYKVETPETKVEVVNAQPIVEKPPVKKRTFVKRQEDGVAKVAKIKAPAKPKAPRKPRTPK